MKDRVPFLTGLILQLILAGLADADQITSYPIIENFDVQNNTGVTATDFHQIYRITDQLGDVVLPLGVGDFYGTTGLPLINNFLTTGNGGVPELEIDWSTFGPGVAPGQTIHFGFMTTALLDPNTQRYGNLVLLDAFWTDGSGRLTPQPLLTSYDGSGFGTSTAFQVTNGNSQPVSVQGLQFLISPTRVPLQNMVPGALQGFGPALPNFVLLPGESLSFNPGNVPSGWFVVAQMTDASTIDPTNSTVNFQQFEARIPEPSSVAISGVGLLLFAFYFRRRILPL